MKAARVHKDLRSPKYKMRVVKSKKQYSRKQKHKTKSAQAGASC
jgi:hypothetical protein